MRFLTTTQLARIYFDGSRWAANKRLRKLMDAGLIHTWVRGLSLENLYSLDRAGSRLLAEQTDDREACAIPRGLDGNMDHLLAINDVRIVVAQACVMAGIELQWWRSDWELRSPGHSVVPDALFAIRWDEGHEQVFALEMDNHTKAPQAFLKKMLKYASVRKLNKPLFGISEFIVLVVGRDPKWIERYRSIPAMKEIALPVWFASHETVCEADLDTPIWKCPADEARYSLRDLSFLPYGNDTFVLETCSRGLS